jgi:hypothetical protein
MSRNKYESKIKGNTLFKLQARKAVVWLSNGIPTPLLKTMLIADRENRPFLDVLNYQMVLYDKQNNQKKASWFLYTNLKKLLPTSISSFQLQEYRNMYFRNAAYPVAAKY